MSGNKLVSAAGYLTLAIVSGVVWAQAPDGHDGWLMQNYRFTSPPPQGPTEPADPVVSELRQIQNTLLTIMRRSLYFEDYEAALAAAGQATSTAQLIGTITERLKSATAEKSLAEDGNSEDGKTNASSIYSIALKDHSVASATAYWVDGLMLHYLTPGGAHIQVRKDLVDEGLSVRLNELKHPGFSLSK